MREVVWEHLESNYMQDEEETYFDSQESDQYQDLIFTPMGVFHKKDAMNPMKHFNFYIGRTSFKISNEDKQLIQSADGVEVFFQWTPYSFLVSPAKMFEWTDVRENIEEKLFGDSDIVIESFVINDESNKDTLLNDFYKELDKSFKFWLIHTSTENNGVFCTYIGCNKPNNNDFKAILDSYRLTDDVNISDSIDTSDFYKKDTQ